MPQAKKLLSTFVLLFGLATALAQSPTTPDSNQLRKVLPIDHFTKFGEFGGIALSPGGDYAAYMTGKYGRTILAVISLKDKKLVGGARLPDGYELYDFDWVSKDRIVYQLAERQPGLVEPTPTGEMGAMDFAGKSQRFIYGYRAGQQTTGTHMKVRAASFATPRIISTKLIDERKLLIAEHPWKEGANSWYFDPDAKPLISLLDTFTGDKKVIGSAPLINATMLADKDNQVRFAVGLNDKFELAASWKPDAKGNWLDFNLPEFDPESITPYLWAEDNKTVVFTGRREKDSLIALYSLDLVTKEVTKLFGFDNTDVTGVVFDFAHKRVIGARSYTDRSAVHWLDENDKAARLRQSLNKAFPGSGVSIASSTEDGRLAIAFVSSDVNPGDYYLFDTTTMKADYLNSAQKWIDPRTMRPKETFSFTTRDGVELHGYITKPSGDGPFPLVVLPHGGPHGVRDYWDFEWDVQLLANRGYAVLQVNYRGSGGYGDQFERSGFGHWGESMQDDVTDATRWAIDRKIAAADNVCIFGASYGGYAALQGVVREPTLYRCAVGYAGIYDLELMMNSADIPRSKTGRAYLRDALGTDRERLRAFSPAQHADKIQVPILLIHGKEDGRADFEQAKRMKAALTKAGKKLEWMALSGEGHGVYNEETRREVYERIVAFLDSNLKGGTGPAK